MKTSIVSLDIRDEHIAEFKSLARKMIENTNKEPGCIFYQAYASDKPGSFFFIEVYKDDAALEAHRSNRNHLESKARLAELWNSAPTVKRPEHL